MEEGNCKHSGMMNLNPTQQKKKKPILNHQTMKAAVMSEIVNKSTRNRIDKQSIEFQYKIIRFMKHYYKKNPSAKRAVLQRAMNRQLKLNWDEKRLKYYITCMIRSYHNFRDIMNKLKLSFEDLDEEYRKPCPFYKELHEALQLSDYYRNHTIRPGRPKKMKPVKCNSSSSSSSMSSEDETDGNVARTRNWNKTRKNSNTKSTKDIQDKDQLNSEKSTNKKCIPSKKMWEKGRKLMLAMRLRKHKTIVNSPKLCRSIANFMKEYFKKNPSSLRIEMIRAYRKETNTPFAEQTILTYCRCLIRSYRLLRWEFDKLKSCPNRKKFIFEQCPFYDDIDEAYQYSDFYRNSNWTPTCKGGRPPRKLSEVQPSTSNASSNDKMGTTDETTDCPTSPETAKRSISEGKNSTRRDRNLEHNVIGREAVVRIPPLKMQGCDQKQANSEEVVIETPTVNVLDCDQCQADSDEVVVVTSPLQLHDCDHQKMNNNKPVEQAKATVKNQVAIDELKLSSEHQLELIKLEDRKEERQFQMQLTKLQQEHEIMKLKLQIKYERVKNLKR